MKKKRIVVAILGSFMSVTLYAQGCSDAGFCTVDGLKSDTDGQLFFPWNTEKHETWHKNQLKVGFSIARADHSILVLGNYVEYAREINDKWIINAKISSLSQQGNGVSAVGFSDVFLSGNYQINSQVKAILGVKLPLYRGNREENDLPLPMDYQSSLGTFDYIVGVGYQVKQMYLVLALQQPIVQNKNKFLAENYPANNLLRTFTSTNGFERGADMLLRISYAVKVNEKFSVTPSLLPIYHLTNDKYVREDGVKEVILGSKGLTLNANLYMDYRINKDNALQLSIGAPFLVRKARPDGLTRSFVVNLEYRFGF